LIIDRISEARLGVYMNNSIEALRKYCMSLAPIKFGFGDTDIRQLLGAAWENLGGAASGGMKANKLCRIEDLEWRPPFLTFTIERHGGTVNGSTRAELQDWEINVESAQATYSERRRQLYKSQPKLDIKPLVKEVVGKITQGKNNACLKWNGKARVKVLVGVVLPKDSCCQATLTGRRRRFQNALAESMQAAGWVQVGAAQAYVFQAAAASVVKARQKGREVQRAT
jgi:hypothetical protein